MNKRPGEVRVTTEVAYCTFCGRPRTLRREERQLGALVRTVVTCETCHRTLSSTVGVADAEPATPDPAEAPASAPAVGPDATSGARPASRPTVKPAPKPATKPATKPSAKPAVKAKAAQAAPKAKPKPKASPAKKKVPPKPRGKGSK